MAGRASLTRHSRHPSTKSTLAPARTVGVCPAPLESPNVTRKSTLRKSESSSLLPPPPGPSQIRTVSVARAIMIEGFAPIQHP